MWARSVPEWGASPNESATEVPVCRMDWARSRAIQQTSPKTTGRKGNKGYSAVRRRERLERQLRERLGEQGAKVFA